MGSAVTEYIANLLSSLSVFFVVKVSQFFFIIIGCYKSSCSTDSFPHALGITAVTVTGGAAERDSTRA